MLKILCILMLLIGAGTMLASIITYRSILKSYLPGKVTIISRYNAIQIMMIFFLFGYVATLIYYLIDTNPTNMSMALIAVIFFFGAIFCYSVVAVQSDLLGSLEKNASRLQEALVEAETANINLESLNNELLDTMNELKNTQSQLVFSEKMSVLGKLMAGIFHEINTPIGVVKASASTMQSIFDDQFMHIFLELHKLSEDDFQELEKLLKISVENNKKFTSTSEIRKLKRSANQVFSNAGFDDALMELAARTYLLDSSTVQTLAEKKDHEALKCELLLISKLLPIFTSLDCVSVAVEKVIKIVSSLKTFSHVSINNEKAPFSVIGGIETVLTLYVNQLKYDVELITEYEEVPNILGYEDELSQVWSNLIQNALYAMDESNNNPQEEARQRTIHITVKNTDDNCVAVSIADNGSGISPEILENLFEPFYTTKPAGIGSGLGLSISKQIVDKHNGTIQVESEKGEGTSFMVKLPV